MANTTFIHVYDAALQGLARTLWEEWMHVSASLSAHDIADVPRAKTESPSDVDKRHALPTQSRDELVPRRVLWTCIAWVDEPHAMRPQDATNEVRPHAVGVAELVNAGAATECGEDCAITLRDFAVSLAAHGLRRLGWFDASQQIARNFPSMPYKRGNHAVNNASRKFVRPLVNCLICDADLFRSGRDGTAQKFDGFGFKHALLNHSSDAFATIVFSGSDMMETMVAYKDRLVTAMSLSGIDAHDLADALEITYTGAMKAIKGGKSGTSEMTASNNSKAAKFMKVDPDWLATGEGEPRSERIWPFGDAITPTQFFALDKTTIQTVLDALVAAVKRREEESDSPPSTERGPVPATLEKLKKIKGIPPPGQSRPDRALGGDK